MARKPRKSSVSERGGVTCILSCTIPACARQGFRPGGGRAQYAVARERCALSLVRLGGRPRQPLVAKPAAAPRCPRDALVARARGGAGPGPLCAGLPAHVPGPRADGG